MSLNKNIKSNALLALRKNWFRASFITLVWIFILAIFFTIECFISMLLDLDFSVLDLMMINIYKGDFNALLPSSDITIFVCVMFGLLLIGGAILSCLKIGDNLWHYKLISQVEGDSNDLFYYYSSFKLMCKSWWMSIQLTVRKLIWCIIIFAPSILVGSWSIVALVYQPNTFDDTLISFGFILSACLLILGVIASLIFFRRYFLARYLLVSGEYKSVSKCINMSTRMMRGKKLDCIGLYISFIGWFLLSLFVLPTIFVAPYVKSSLAIYAKYILESYKLHSSEHDINPTGHIS